MRRGFVSAANTARNGRRAKPRPFKRRELVLAANTARKWVQDETLLMRRELVSAANTARKWVQGEALPGKE